jgi:hypothetical protein
MASRELVQALRDWALNATHSVQLSLDNPQTWPAILTYADTIEADDPDEAERLRRLVTCHKNGVRPVRRRHFTAEEDAQKMVDYVKARLRSKRIRSL